MEILENNETQQQNDTPTTPSKPQGCLAVGARVIMGVIFFLSAATFLGCVIAASVLPITSAGLQVTISETELIRGPIYIAVFVCVLVALASALVAYISFCVAFNKPLRGWCVAVLIALLIGGAIGGSIHGVKLGHKLFNIAEEIERLDDILDTVNDDDMAGIVRGFLSVGCDSSIKVVIDDCEELVILDALDIDEKTKNNIREIVVVGDQEVQIKVEQEVESDGSRTQKITIQTPDEDINITKTIPTTPLPTPCEE